MAGTPEKQPEGETMTNDGVRFWLLLLGVSALVVAGIWALAVIVRMGLKEL